ncbi:hypothetical protein, partial [Methylobacterium nigriterrae]|uniref:hypothetical protein n=1 Tax=Methylobacterium nigriterrae TaxID=3127512 RepID=UPI00301375DB
MDVKERPAGTPDQRLRGEVARSDHPGGSGRVLGPIHRAGRIWTARWERGFVSLVEVGERDLWLWLVSPADPEGADQDREETELGLPVGSRQAA